MVEQVRQS
jgi:hypothetical protein